MQGKVNMITLDQCRKTGLVFQDLVAACEIVNCTGVQVQATGTVKTLAIDKCDGVQVSPARSQQPCLLSRSAGPAGPWVLVVGCLADALQA